MSETTVDNMKIDFTPLFRPRFVKIARRVAKWEGNTKSIQTQVLKSLLNRGKSTEYGKKYHFVVYLIPY